MTPAVVAQDGFLTTHHFTLSFGSLSLLQVSAGDKQLVIYRMQGEKIFRTDFDTVVAGCAEGFVHNRKAMSVHFDGIEIADIGTIGHAQAAPGTPLAATGDQGRPTAGV